MTDDIVARLEADLQAMKDRMDGQWAEIANTRKVIEPITRQAARDGLVKSLESEGKVVKDKKPAAKSTTIQVSVTGLVSACVAAYGAWQAGDMQTFAASVGAAVAAALAIWRRFAVGDLQ